MVRYVIIAFVSFFILSQCTYHNIDEYFEEVGVDTITNCDTVDVSFSKAVFPIIADNCISCHNDIVTYGDRNYDTYEGIVDATNSGKLLNVIKHTPGYVQMPRDADKLPQCYIDIIQAWIEQGSKNN